MGIYRSVADAGYVAGPTLLGLIADAAGAGLALQITAGLFLVAALAFGGFAPEIRKGLRHVAAA